MISTGCNGLDKILNGGIRFNTITNIYGESATGKTQFCFQLSMNITSKQDGSVCFIDMLNNFRPERIMEMAYHNDISNDILDKIYVVRPLTIDDVMDAINKIDDVRLIIIDDISELLLNIDSKDVKRTLVLFMRMLALKAIKHDLAIVITNRVTLTGIHTRQKFDDIISRFIHFKIVFSKANGIFSAKLLYPTQDNTYFRISRKGLEDVYL